MSQSSSAPVAFSSASSACSCCHPAMLVAEEVQYLGDQQIRRCVESLMPGTWKFRHGCGREHPRRQTLHRCRST